MTNEPDRPPDLPPEAEPADVLEQATLVDEHEEDDRGRAGELPVEADEADVLEQQQALPDE